MSFGFGCVDAVEIVCLMLFSFSFDLCVLCFDCLVVFGGLLYVFGLIFGCLFVCFG